MIGFVKTSIFSSVQPEKIHPVILAGGPGYRLKPWSRPTCPKPFLSIGGHSLLQATLARLRGFSPLVLCQHDHLVLAQEQAEAVTPLCRFLTEPLRRNTGPAVAAATAHLLAEQGPDALMLVMPSDHAIDRPDLLMNEVRKRVQIAPGRILSFGVKPRGPSSRFGYIIPAQDHVRFVEKPSRSAARAFIKAGAYWNSGIWMTRVGTMRDLLAGLAPEVWEPAQKALTYARHEGAVTILEERYFTDCPACAIDKAVMEKAPAITMVPLDLRWRDLGTWPSMVAHLLRL